LLLIPVTSCSTPSTVPPVGSSAWSRPIPIRRTATSALRSPRLGGP